MTENYRISVVRTLFNNSSFTRPLFFAPQIIRKEKLALTQTYHGILRKRAGKRDGTGPPKTGFDFIRKSRIPEARKRKPVSAEIRSSQMLKPSNYNTERTNHLPNWNIVVFNNSLAREL